jgi:hypothetical protein
MKAEHIFDYVRPIYKQWDKDGYPCEHNPKGWVAWLEQRIRDGIVWFIKKDN